MAPAIRFCSFFDRLFSTLSPLVVGKEARIAAARAAGFSGEKKTEKKKKSVITSYKSVTKNEFPFLFLYELKHAVV